MKSWKRNVAAGLGILMTAGMFPAVPAAVYLEDVDLFNDALT